MYKDKSVRVARREGDVSGRRRECLNDERRTCRGASEDLGLAFRVSRSFVPVTEKIEQLECDGLNS